MKMSKKLFLCEFFCELCEVSDNIHPDPFTKYGKL